MMKIAFFGTGEFSKNILESLINFKSLEIKLVVSQPDKPVGRKKIITKTPVKIISEKNDIEILQPIKLRNSSQSSLSQNSGLLEEFYKKLKSLNLDFIIVVAYGNIIPQEILDIPKFGAINIHGSLLPKYRGASPIQESIKNGDKETGLTIMYMSSGMDEGDILSTKKVKINLRDKTSNIFKKFEQIAPKLLVKTLEKIVFEDLKGTSQNNSEATYCSKIKKNDGELDFEKQSAKQIYDTCRAYEIWPGIFTYFNGKKLQISECFFDEIDLEIDENFNIGDVIELESEGKKQIGVICKTGILILEKVKLEGKKQTDIMSFVNGNKDFLDYNFIRN